MKRTHKFGIRFPKLVREAYDIDRENGDTLWTNEIAKEMKNARVALKILDDDDPIPVGHQQIRCHGIFDLKMDLFQRKF